MSKEVTKMFEKQVGNYLKAMAANDAAFAGRLALPDKSIGECCRYIYQTVRASGRCGFADSEIYGMAVHYYDEDDVDVSKTAPSPKQIVLNRAVELSEEERAEAREKAKERLVAEEVARLRKPERKPTPAPAKTEEREPLLF